MLCCDINSFIPQSRISMYLQQLNIASSPYSPPSKNYRMKENKGEFCAKPPLFLPVFPDSTVIRQ